jgi:signal transduction histidine kinase
VLCVTRPLATVRVGHGRSLAAVDWSRRWWSNRYVVDLLVWVVVTVPVVLSDEALPSDARLTRPTSIAVVAAVLAVAVAVSRRWPSVAAALPLVVAIVVGGEVYGEPLLVAQIVLAYLLGRRTGGRRAAVHLLAVLAVAAVALAVVQGGGTADDWFTFASTLLLQVVLPWTAGQLVRQNAELARAGWDLAERLEREHDLVASQVRARERGRIASDMHDSLGHELSLIAVRAAGLQVASGLDADARRAAGELRHAAAAATERLHQIIGMLRDDADRPPVVPAGESIPELVRRAAGSGVDVTLVEDGVVDDGAGEGAGDIASDVAGDVAGEDGALPEPTARAAYRVVQEALTNATKHAPGAPVTVRLRRAPGELVVEVVNALPAVGVGRRPGHDGGTGFGLVGLDERVRLVGGHLEARADGDGFTVRARLPLDAASVVEPATPPSTGTGSADELDAPDAAAVRDQLATLRRRLRLGMVWTALTPALIAAALVLYYVLDGGRL